MRRIAPFLIAGIILGIAPVTSPDLPVRVMEYVKPEPPTEVTVMAVGDMMLSRAVAKKMQQHGYDYPFASTTDFIQSADIAFGNLETPITMGPEVLPFEMRFRADREVASSLKRAGFDVLSIANNHMLDFGPVGVADTRAALDAEGLLSVGAGMNAAEAGQSAFITAKGLTFAFLAFSYAANADTERAGTAPLQIEPMQMAVRRAKDLADFVIVSMHAGEEYELLPTDAQIAFARAAIDAGADMVIGHHAHVVQTAELYRGKHIFYGLGNFVFDQMWSQETREGMALEIIFTEEGVKAVAHHPVLIEDYAQPRFIEDPAHSGRIVERLSAPNAPVDRR